MAYKKSLVIGFVGDESYHSTWIDSKQDALFDLFLFYFGNQPNRYKNDADYYLPIKGFKFHLLKKLMSSELKGVIDKYEYIWLPDDDIAADTSKINRLFDLCRKHQLRVAQPAIQSGELSYESLRVDSRFELRFSPYVEMMCPILRQDAFKEALPTFDETVSCWGIDWIWSRRCRQNEIAVIDAAPVDHMRPLCSGSLHKQFSEMDVTPHLEFKQLLKRYKIRCSQVKHLLRYGKLRMKGIKPDGSSHWNRSARDSLFQIAMGF